MENSVGILTLSASDNCGSLLQTYALQYILETSFHAKVNVIDFDGVQSRIMYNIFPPDPLHHLKKTILGILFYPALKKQKDDYNAFRKTYLNLTEKKYLDHAALRDVDGQFDYIFTGSDQVWNIHMPDFDDSFLLNWVQKSAKVAYAPSLGGSDFSGYPDREALKNNLLSYRSLSTREVNGQRAIYDIIGRKVPIIGDPTLLVGKEVWDELAGERLVGEDYIFFYSWAYDNYKLNQIVADYAKKNHLQVYVINASKWQRHQPGEYGFKLFSFGGPKAFLNLMKHAKKVFVESFHGVIFANKFEKDFYFLDNHEEGVLDARLDSILTLFNKKDRVVRRLEDIEEESIDYTVQNEAYDALVKDSLEYIKGVFQTEEITV